MVGLRTIIISSLLTVCTLTVGVRKVRADEVPRFQPPRPPTLDDVFDDDDDPIELDDPGGPPGRMPMIPPSMGAMGTPGGMGDMRNPAQPPLPAPNLNGPTTSAKKFRFKVVEGEFFEKGKRRARGAQVHVTGDSEK